MIGRGAALLTEDRAVHVRQAFSIDEWLRTQRAAAPDDRRAPSAWRWDEAAAWLPYQLIGIMCALAAFLRRWELPRPLCVAATVCIMTCSAVCVLRHHRERAKSDALGLDDDEYRNLMLRFSRLTRRPATMDLAEFTALFLLPVAYPVVGALFFGPLDATGQALAGVLFCVNAPFAWKMLRDARGRPAAVLLLGSSTPAAIALHARLSRELSPLRVVSLLQVDQDDAESQALPPSQDCLRTIWSEGWHDVVVNLSRFCAVVVLDARVTTDACVSELSMLVANGTIARTVLACDDDGRTPLVDAWEAAGNRMPRSVAPLARVTPDRVVAKVAAALEVRRAALSLARSLSKS